MLSPYKQLALSPGSTLGGGVSFTAEYQDVYDAMTTKPSDSIAAEQDALVKTLVDEGVWDKLDLFYLFAQEVNSDGEALINWINPGTFDASLVSAPTFTSLEGFTGNGSSAYIRTGYNTTTNATNFKLNDASQGFYVRLNLVGSEAMTGGLHSSSYSDFYPRHATYGYISRFNAGTAINGGATSDARGMWATTRPDSANSHVYHNKVKTSHVSASTSLVNVEVIYLAKITTATPGAWSNNQVSMGFLGGSLTDDEVGYLTDAVEVYMDSNSKGVIT